MYPLPHITCVKYIINAPVTAHGDDQNINYLLCDYLQNTFDQKVPADFRISGLEMIGLNLGGQKNSLKGLQRPLYVILNNVR